MVGNFQLQHIAVSDKPFAKPEVTGVRNLAFYSDLFKLKSVNKL